MCYMRYSFSIDIYIRGAFTAWGGKEILDDSIYDMYNIYNIYNHAGRNPQKSWGLRNMLQVQHLYNGVCGTWVRRIFSDFFILQPLAFLGLVRYKRRHG